MAMQGKVLQKIHTKLVSNYFGMSAAVVISFIFIMIYSYFSITRYLSLNATAWDLGIHTQALWSFLHGKFFYSLLLGKSLMAIHFQPFIFILVPLFYAFPTPVSLLIFQSIFLALSALILYDISFRVLARRFRNLKIVVVISILIELSYLISPLTFGSVLFDFHFLSFLPFFYFLAIDSFLTGRRVIHLLSLAFIVSLHSNFVYIVACILLFEFLLESKKGYGILEAETKRTKKFRFFVLLGSFFVLYLYVMLSGLAKGMIIVGFSRGLTLGFSHVVTLPGTGQVGSVASTPTGLLLALIERPAYVWSFIVANYVSKIYFILIAIGTTGILSILYLPALIPLLPFLSFALFSNYSPYYILGYQYSAMIEPVLYVALLFSIVFIVDQIAKIKNIKIKRMFKGYEKTVLAVVCVSIVIAIPFSPISPHSVYIGDRFGNLYDVSTYRTTPATGFIFQVRESMPSNAYILTQNNLMPYFSRFINVDSTPYTCTVEQNLNNFSYLVIQASSPWAEYSSAGFSLDRYANTYIQEGWNVMAEYGEYSILVIQKHPSDVPLLLIPMNESYSFHRQTSNVTDGNYTHTGFVHIDSLLPGNYTVSLNTSGDLLAFTSNVTIHAYLNTTTGSRLITEEIHPSSFGKIKFYLENDFILHDMYIYVNTTGPSQSTYIENAVIHQLPA